MNNEFPYDDEPNFDATHAAPPPDYCTEDEPTIVPPPPQPVNGKPTPVPRARRQLKDEAELLKQALKVLKERELGENAHLNHRAIDALVCAMLDLQLPLDADNPHVARRREQARHGQLNAYVALAMDELEDALATLEAALAALKAISLLDEPIPAEWGNLGPIPLARKLNGLGHVLLRGRIAGVNI
ncbi:hypothetical protein [Devosia salina]|uniref:Uncharacterized protein n=1 Tax=Devosia salina TaxID=2860336 RepID=A0ABX8WCY7_9HYPH|nr:hypothetical protein [Devosia salina]QYO76542.1 hypothetical protein K1X15_18440 [Devosia salina]